MSGFAKSIVLGRATRDAEIKTARSGTTWCRFSIAVNRRGRGQRDDDSGDDGGSDSVHYFDFVAFGGKAEECERLVRRGAMLLIESRLQHDRWETDSGEKRSAVKHVVETIEPTTGGQPTYEPGDDSEPPPRGAKRPDDRKRPDDPF